MRQVIAALVVGIFAGQAGAEVMTASPRPILRPEMRPEMQAVADAAVEPALSADVAALAALRPRARPDGLIAAVAEGATGVEDVAAVAPRKGLFGGLLRPKPRPEAGEGTKAALRGKPSRSATTSMQGAVCGDPSIRGETMSPIKARTKGCGIAEPVSVTSVAGVRLSQAGTMDCPTALALKRWVEDGLQPTLGRDAAVELTVAAHYICRSRNNVRGARISEHGRGRAIDISGVQLEGGKSLSVQRNFRTLRAAHKAACGVFGTTLGPGSDGYHEDNLHFDTAAYRGGPYCR
ncbi:MAG: extensin family protein [Pseudomonadota bacterium]